ncbi:MAG: lipid II flippase MurJ [bacterium]
MAGFARTAAFGRGVGSGCVGDVYQTANYVPNIVFDIVAGGMLSALVVPVLAPVLAAGDRARADRLISALLCWAVVVLVPVALLVALAAGPVINLLLGAQTDCPGAHALGTRMLVVFAPQVVFYGVGVILGAVLSAGERFAWPALAPLLSSIVVVVVYVAYWNQVGSGRDVLGLPSSAEYLLSVGTTAGVVVLTLCLAPAVRRTGARLRPTLRFPIGVARTVRIAAVAGAATLAAQEISSAVMIRLANSGTARGTLVAVTLAQTVFLLPWAVLSLPVATAAFPRLAAHWTGGRTGEFRSAAGTATGAVLVAATAGTALLVAVAEPAGIVLLGPGAAALAAFAPATVGFAIGLLGWSLVAVLARVSYAAGHVRAAATAQVAGQLTVIAVDVVLSLSLPADRRALALGIGNSVGVSVAALGLVLVTARGGALSFDARLQRTLLAALGASAVAGALGWLVGRRAEGSATVPAAGLGLVAALLAAAVFVAVLSLTDPTSRGQLRRRLRVRFPAVLGPTP